MRTRFCSKWKITASASPAEKLAQLHAELEDDSGEIKLESGFGIGNVNKRIRLYYGKAVRPLDRSSEYNTGTCVRW